MQPKKMAGNPTQAPRVFTCTPVPFGGGPDFFARDSGLLCRGLQSHGMDSRAVMPGEAVAEDEEDLIRTSYQNLESAAWWRAQKVDAVVLYAWGSPKFRFVAAAIRQSGAFLILNQDSSGFVSPLAGPCEWLSEQWILSGKGKRKSDWARYVLRVVRGLTAGLLLTDPLRAQHFSHGHVIACVSPLAAERYAKLGRRYGPSTPRRFAVLPHGVETAFCYDGSTKRRQVVCIGRWSDRIQKRGWLMMETITQLLHRDARACVVVAGETTEELRCWHQELNTEFRQRVTLAGILSRSQLVEVLKASSVFYSPSAYESFGIAAAEALCTGCSVVAGRSVSMPSFDWFVSENSGTLSEMDNAAGHVEALMEELSLWDSGSRDAARISKVWSERLHASQLALGVMKLLMSWNDGSHR